MKKIKIPLLFERVLNAPLIMWVLLGFSITYLFFFIYPIFLSNPIMQFPRYVPAMDPIGVDLKANLSFSNSLFFAKKDTGNYTPLTNILFAPLLFLKFYWAYRIITLINVFCYVLLTLVVPLRIAKNRQVPSLLMLLFITGLFSYGFQFELERGQFNVIAISMCFLAIWIYHYHNRYRFLAYILFIISVQLKAYPLIFIVMLIGDWHDWKNNIKRVLILVIVNIALLFVLGYQAFLNFLKTITGFAGVPYIWSGNHSIFAFVALFSQKLYEHGWVWAKQNSGLVQNALLAIIAVCIFLIILKIYRQKQTGLNSYLLLACTIGALVIPSVSNDYTLSFLTAPVAILLLSNGFFEQTQNRSLHIVMIVLLLVFSIAYSSTLFSITNSPSLFFPFPRLLPINKFPPLFVMLLVVTLFSLLSKPGLQEKLPEPTETS